MNIIELFDKKHKLEREVSALIKAFEAETTLRVHSVALTRSFTLGTNYSEISNVFLEVVL